jgi:multiple sugar transport system substrate-binding protein
MSAKGRIVQYARCAVLSLVILVLVTGMALAEEKTLSFWIYGGAQVRDPILKVVEDFEKLRPGVKVEVQIFADWPDLNRKALLALAAGDPPDIMRGKPQLLAEFASRGALMPLDDLIAREQIDTSQFIDVLFEKSSKYQGVTYAFPFHAAAPALWYNPELFEEAGLDRPPDTWEECIEFGKKLTDPFKRQWGFYVETGYNGFIWYLWQAGGQYINEDHTKVAFNSPQGRETLQWIVDAMHKYRVAPTREARSDQMIFNNQVGIWQTYSELRAVYRRDHPNMVFKTAVFPKNVARTSMEMSSAMVIFNASKVKEEAWELLKFLCLNEDNQRYIMSQSNFLPVHKDVLTGPPWSEDEFYAPFVWQLLYDINARPIVVGADEMTAELQAQLDEAYFQRKTVEQALADAESKLNAILERNQ